MEESEFGPKEFGRLFGSLVACILDEAENQDLEIGEDKAILLAAKVLLNEEGAPLGMDTIKAIVEEGEAILGGKTLSFEMKQKKATNVAYTLAYFDDPSFFEGVDEEAYSEMESAVKDGVTNLDQAHNDLALSLIYQGDVEDEHDLKPLLAEIA